MRLALIPLTLAIADALLHQRVARLRKFEKCLGVASGIGVHSLGRALEGAMNLGRAQALIRRQAEQFAVMLLRGQRLAGSALAPAEARRRLRMQRIADDAKPSSRGFLRSIVSAPERGVA